MFSPVIDEPLDLRIGCAPRWTYYPVYPCPQPLPVPAAGPSPIWTPMCKPDLQSTSPKLHLAPRSPHTPHAIFASASELQFPPGQDKDDDGYLSDDPEYQQYKTDAFHVMAEKNGGSLVSHNPRMRRSVQSSQDADESYRTRRERNNLAAKQSRDRRKLRELDSALKVSFLKKKLAEVNVLLAARVCGRCRIREL